MGSSTSIAGNSYSLPHSIGNSVNFSGVFDPSHALSCLRNDFNSIVDWIVDPGASNHMTSHSQFFPYKTRNLKRPI